MGRVVVAGSINLDIVIRVAALPRPGQTVAGHDLERLPGGKGANQAVASARAGASTSMLGRLGDDDPADVLRAFLDDAGVDTSGILSSPGPTGTAVVVVDERAENSIVVVAGANGLVEPEDVDEVARELGSGDVAVTQLEIPMATAHAFLQSAHERGATTVCNPAPAALLPADFVEVTDVLVMNEGELLEIGGVPSRRAGQVLVVTLGPAGVRIVDDDGERFVDGHAIKPVDTTGAGDCFVGSLAARLAEGDDLPTSAKYANAAAALCAMRPGAGPSMPTASEVAELLGQDGPRRRREARTSR